MVGQHGFNRQNGRNQAFNHAGNMVGAGVSGYLGWQFGFVAVFLLAALFGLISIACVMMIPRDAIDDDVARGLGNDVERSKRVSGITVLLECKPLLALAAALALFHLGNAAMLPFFGLAVVDLQNAEPASFVAITIVIAQATMIVMSIIAMRAAERTGYWTVLLISFVALPIRGLIAAHMISKWGVVPVQILDGVGAGLQSVAVPGLVARILNGTGRVNLGQGAVMTVQGIGAALSPVLGGWLAQGYGYPVAFTLLGALALGSIMIWIASATLIRQVHVEPASATATS
jgi:predicted MFS family arabinose efflux permease